MTDENALAIINNLSGGISTQNDQVFDEIAGGGDWLPRIQLMTSRSSHVDEGKIEAQHWAVFLSNDPTDLGKEVDIFVIAWRPKAVDLSGDVPIICHDTKEEAFKRIQADSEVQDSGCMYGPDFLVYIHGSDKFATLFMGTKSSRRESTTIKGLMPGNVTLSSKYIEGKKYKWWAPKGTKCQSPVKVPDTDEWRARLRDVADKFLNPPAPQVEVAEESSEDRER